MGYANLFRSIEASLLERGEVVVSGSYDNLNQGADCLDGQLELFCENELGRLPSLAGMEVVFKKKVANDNRLYQLRRKVK